MRRSSIRTSCSAVALPLALLCACFGVSGCGSSSQAYTDASGGSRALAARAAIAARLSTGANYHRLFSPSSFWNQLVPSGAPLDPASAALVGSLDATIAAEEQAGNGPWIDTTSYSVPIYTVPAHQRTVRVIVDQAHALSLAAAFRRVPLPAGAKPAAGTDAHLVVWQRSTDRLWEFWQLTHKHDGWHASWGGAMRKVSKNPGVYGTGAWPGAKSSWGASACSLSIAGGLITFEELQRGQIGHALALSLPEVRAGVHASPARRDDGTSGNPLALPEGAHLRLDPNLDLASLHLPRLTLMIAEAAQRYGIVVRDRARNVAFYAQDPTPTGTEPYAGAGGYFEGRYPSRLLASFPWSGLQVLRMSLHGAASRPLGGSARRQRSTG